MNQAYTPPLDEILFLLDNVIHWSNLLDLPPYTELDRETFTAILSEAAKFATRELSPINEIGDDEGCQLLDGRVRPPSAFLRAFRKYVTEGWCSMEIPEEYGGQRLPLLLGAVISEMNNGACIAFSMLPCMLRSAAHLLIAHADPDLRDCVVPHLASGNYSATIVITEPQAGSDVSRINCRAVKQTDGSFSITGSKVFISYGDHNWTDQILHMVLARTENAGGGSSGLSLFMVPKLNLSSGAPNGVTVLGIEKKMGLRGSPTCALEFKGAIGYLIGEQNKGLNCLFTMMNTMRLEVASQSTGIASACLQRARTYAGFRIQGGAGQEPIEQHADIRRTLVGMHAFTVTIRALTYETAINLDKAKHGTDELGRRQDLALAEFLLPVCKAWGSDTAFSIANQALQVFGGHGYIKDQGIEQYVRDSRALSIYEGTNGIQAQDLVIRKLLKQGATGYHQLVSRIEQTIAAATTAGTPRELIFHVESTLERYRRCTASLMESTARSIRFAQAVATPYLELTGLVAGAWMWLRIATNPRPSTPIQNEYTSLSIFYMRYLLPKTQLLEAQVYAGAELIDNCFGGAAPDKSS